MFDFIPNDLTALSADEKKALQDKLDEALIEQGQAYQQAVTAAAETEAEYKQAQENFERQHADLIERRSNRIIERDEIKMELQRAAAVRRQLTGEKTWVAFQCAESWVMDYQAEKMLKWLINEAPGGWKMQFLKLDSSRLNTELVSRLDEFGVPKPLEGAGAIPATGRQHYTGKVLADKLPLLAGMEKPAVKADELAASYIATLTSPEPSTDDEALDPIPF